MSKKRLLELASQFDATDITYLDFDKINELRNKENGLETIQITYGTYGMNSGLFKGVKSGKYYVIKSRTTALFQLA